MMCWVSCPAAAEHGLHGKECIPPGAVALGPPSGHPAHAAHAGHVTWEPAEWEPWRRSMAQVQLISVSKAHADRRQAPSPSRAWEYSASPPNMVSRRSLYVACCSPAAAALLWVSGVARVEVLGAPTGRQHQRRALLNDRPGEQPRFVQANLPLVWGRRLWSLAAPGHSVDASAAVKR